MTALIYACWYGYIDIAQILLASRLSRKCRYSSKDNWSACAFRCLELIIVALSLLACLNSYLVLKVVCLVCCVVCCQNWATDLMHACVNDRFDVARMLISEFHANIDIQSEVYTYI